MVGTGESRDGDARAAGVVPGGLDSLLEADPRVAQDYSIELAVLTLDHELLPLDPWIAKVRYDTALVVRQSEPQGSVLDLHVGHV